MAEYENQYDLYIGSCLKVNGNGRIPREMGLVFRNKLEWDSSPTAGNSNWIIL